MDSNPHDDSEEQASTPTDSRNGKVGYKNPPKHAQFKKGQSGNPNGRRKGSLGVGPLTRKVFGEYIKIKVDGATAHVSAIEAILMRIKAGALKGEPKPTKLALELYVRYNPEEPKENSQLEALFAALLAGPVDTPAGRSE